MSTIAAPTELRAFHGDPAIRETYLARVEAHQKADQIVQGYGYWKDGKGCAVGCTLHSGNHLAYETELGIPVAVAHIQDSLFELLPRDLARQFPARFLRAPKVGADLSLVAARMVVWYLLDPQDGAIRFATEWPDIAAVIQNVGALYQRVIDGGTVTAAEWNEAADLAALEALADLAALEDRADLADLADRAALAARAALADLADRAALAARAARAAYSVKAADKFISLLEAA